MRGTGRNWSRDDRKALGEHLEQATGERVAALESLEPAPEAEKPRAQAPVPEQQDDKDRGVERVPGPSWDMPMEWTGPDLEM